MNTRLKDFSIFVLKIMMNEENISKRSKNMSAIKSKDTSIEVILRKELWKRGLRYRKNDKTIFGNPDIIFKSKRIAVFCDSEFWHGKKFLNGEIPKTNSEFWIRKLNKNIERDKTVNKILKKTGWTVLRFSDKEIKLSLNLVANIIENYLKQ
ncbi:MAG: very short patch repair endonuclease [Bacteroidota bacterium]